MLGIINPRSRLCNSLPKLLVLILTIGRDASMIKINESTEYEVGFEMSKVAGVLRGIQKNLESPKEMDVQDIRSKIDTVLDVLSKIHDWMAEG